MMSGAVASWRAGGLVGVDVSHSQAQQASSKASRPAGLEAGAGSSSDTKAGWPSGVPGWCQADALGWWLSGFSVRPTYLVRYLTAEGLGLTLTPREA